MIYQRTELGNTEIRQKRLGLLKAERLMLVLVDGVSQFADLKQQVKSRDAETFDAAIEDLLTQGLIYEVMLVVKGQVPDVVESELLDRFLREDIRDSQKPAKTTNFQIPSAIISESHEGVGVSIDTRKQTNLPLGGEAELDLYLPLGSSQDVIPPEVLVLKAARKKVKVVQVFPEPERRKRKRRKKKLVETGLDRRALFYAVLLFVALVIIGASIYIRSK